MMLAVGGSARRNRETSFASQSVTVSKELMKVLRNLRER